MPYLGAETGICSPTHIGDDEQVPMMPEQIAAQVAAAIAGEAARRAAGSRYRPQLGS